MSGYYLIDTLIVSCQYSENYRARKVLTERLLANLYSNGELMFDVLLDRQLAYKSGKVTRCQSSRALA